MYHTINFLTIYSLNSFSVLYFQFFKPFTITLFIVTYKIVTHLFMSLYLSFVIMDIIIYYDNWLTFQTQFYVFPSFPDGNTLHVPYYEIMKSSVNLDMMRCCGILWIYILYWLQIYIHHDKDYIYILRFKNHFISAQYFLQRLISYFILLSSSII